MGGRGHGIAKAEQQRAVGILEKLGRVVAIPSKADKKIICKFYVWLLDEEFEVLSKEQSGFIIQQWLDNIVVQDHLRSQVGIDLAEQSPSQVVVQGPVCSI